MKSEKKILVITSTVENCDTDVDIINGYDDIFALVKEDIMAFMPCFTDRVEDIVQTLKEKGQFVSMKDDEVDCTIVYSEFGSVFGTETITFKMWGTDDILSRYAITYIVMA